jgi:hypothetical protein
MQENLSVLDNIPSDLQNVIKEIVAAHIEHRLVTLRFSDPTITQIIGNESEGLRKIYIQIKPKEEVH